MIIEGVHFSGMAFNNVEGGFLLKKQVLDSWLSRIATVLLLC